MKVEFRKFWTETRFHNRITLFIFIKNWISNLLISKNCLPYKSGICYISKVRKLIILDGRHWNLNIHEAVTVEKLDVVTMLVVIWKINEIKMMEQQALKQTSQFFSDCNWFVQDGDRQTLSTQQLSKIAPLQLICTLSYSSIETVFCIYYTCKYLLAMTF